MRVELAVMIFPASEAAKRRYHQMDVDATSTDLLDMSGGETLVVAEWATVVEGRQSSVGRLSRGWRYGAVFMKGETRWTVDIGDDRERQLARINSNPLAAENYRLAWPCPEHKEIGMQYLTGG